MKFSSFFHQVISAARKQGFAPQERNKTARKHFYFDHPNGCQFSAHAFKPSVESFTIGHDTTSSPERAILLLVDAVEEK